MKWIVFRIDWRSRAVATRGSSLSESDALKIAKRLTQFESAEERKYVTFNAVQETPQMHAAHQQFQRLNGKPLDTLEPAT